MFIFSITIGILIKSCYTLADRCVGRLFDTLHYFGSHFGVIGSDGDIIEYHINIVCDQIGTATSLFEIWPNSLILANNLILSDLISDII